MFAREYRGNRANSAAIHPRFRTIARITALCRLSSQSGNARRKLNSAVRRNFGEAAYITAAADDAKPRAVPRGITPRAFKISHTAAYSSHVFIACTGRDFTTDARQYAFSSLRAATLKMESHAIGATALPAPARFARRHARL